MSHVRGSKVVSIGAGAADTLETGERRGEVVAVYTRSCYLRFPDDRLVCVGSLSLDDGPLTARVAFPPGYDMGALGIRSGATVDRTEDGLRLGDVLWLDTSDAGCWSPPSIEGFADFTIIERRIDLLVSLLEPIAPDAGLAPLLGCAASLAKGETSATDGQFAKAASPKVTQLIRGMWWRNGLEMDAGIAGLVGLGPGLTPSGDDLLGGIMIGMWAMGEAMSDLRDPLSRIGRTLNRIAKSQTTAVSSALLRQAAKGAGSASVHRLAQSLLQSHDAPDPLDSALQVSNSGHTSGWDCLAGLLIGVHFGLQVGAASAYTAKNI